MRLKLLVLDFNWADRKELQAPELHSKSLDSHNSHTLCTPGQISSNMMLHYLSENYLLLSKYLKKLYWISETNTCRDASKDYLIPTPCLEEGNNFNRPVSQIAF